MGVGRLGMGKEEGGQTRVTIGMVYVRSPGTLPTDGQFGVTTPPYYNSRSTLWSKEKSFQMCPGRASTILEELVRRAIMPRHLMERKFTGRTFPAPLDFY